MTPRTTPRPVRRLLGLAALLGLVLASCRDELPQSSLNPAGPQARTIDGLFTPVFWIAAGVFVVVEGAILFAALRYRSRNGRVRNPVQVHGNTRLEIVWTVIPAVILAIIAVPTVRTIFALAEPPDDPDTVNIEVIAHQWWWEFRYPELGIVTGNEMYMPVQRPVHLELHSAEVADSGADRSAIPVIHSFWIPRLGGKQDMVPGRVAAMTLEADEPGTYPGQCAEFCGLSHANMRFRAIAVSDADFDAWVQSMRDTAAGPPEEPAEGEPMTPEQEGEILFGKFTTGDFPAGFSCFACHAVDANLGEDTKPGQTTAVGPNLARFGERQTLGAGIFENTEENLRRWLDDPRAMKPGAIMPDYGLSEQQIDALVAYLMSLQ